MTRISLFFTLLLLSGCLDLETQCCDYINTKKVGEKLYLEKYRTFCAGVFGERLDYFLTDSIKFRKLIGSTDEHSHLLVIQNGDSIRSLLFEDSYKTETTGIRKLLLSDLKRTFKIDTNFRNNKPLFGKNTLMCNNHKDYTSIKIRKGYYINELQFICNKNYLNGVYFTDSLHFRVLMGFYEPGNDPSYSVSFDGADSVSFIETKSMTNIDTISNTIFGLTKLKAGKLENACKNR